MADQLALFAERGRRAQAAVAGELARAAEARAASQASLTARVLELLQPGVALTPDEIAEALGCSVLSVRPIVTRLCEEHATRPAVLVRTGDRRRTGLGGRAHVVTRAAW